MADSVMRYDLVALAASTRKPSDGAEPSSSSPCMISSCATAVEYRSVSMSPLAVYFDLALASNYGVAVVQPEEVELQR